MRTAIFGGTFNPIHSAHLEMAREAADTFALDRVLFIPAGNPPHKEAATPYEHRYRMVELACAYDPRFVASRLEEGSEKSYSIHTIERVKASGGGVFFIIGSDALAEITTWHRWEDVGRRDKRLNRWSLGLCGDCARHRNGNQCHHPSEMGEDRRDAGAE